MSDGEAAYSEWKGWSPTDFGVCSEDEGRYFAAEVGPLIGAGAKVLEVGYGNGKLLAFLRRHGCRVVGVETNSELVRRARDAGFRTAADLGSLAGEGFDLAVAFDVFEHVPDAAAVAFLASIAATLRPGGKVLLRFPNGDSPFGRAYQHGDPTHVTAVGSLKVRYVAQEAGLDVIGFKNPEVPIGSHAPKARMKHALARGIRSAVERLVGFAYFGGRMPLAPNLVAVLAKP